MYYLILINILFIGLFSFILFKKYFNHIQHLTFEENNNNKDIILDNIRFYDKNNCLLLRVPKDESKFKLKMNLNDYKNLDFTFYTINYEYLIINYIYKNKIYKWIESNKTSTLKFPFYNKDEYKNYVYLNKIDKIYLDGKIMPNLENDIIPFLGPNYNFYNDLNYKITFKQILNYLNIKYKEESIVDLVDKFENKKTFKLDENLNWDPELKFKM